MNASVLEIPFIHLALAFIPVGVVIGIFYRWSLDYRNALYATSRMLVQLLLIGYFLAYIFKANSSWIVLLVLAIMIFASSWIALLAVKQQRVQLYSKALLSIVAGGGLVLILVTQGVLTLEPWFMPRYVIPLAGMIFANAMNSVSIGAERLLAEMGRDGEYKKARGIAFRASLIPTTNAFFAVGLVSLPGMMTGQILSGVSPFIAARYQIMVMCMVYGAAGISSALFLTMFKSHMTAHAGREKPPKQG